MKIGIIVHSHTGNTLSVAQKLMDKLLAEGHSVSLERVEAINEDQNEAGKVKLKSVPVTDGYDLLIFGAPVRGFSLSPVMAAYLSKMKPITGKKVACFLTQAFPHPAMGGNRAMGQMKELCCSKGVEVCGTGIVNWSNINRRRRIDSIVERFSGLH